MNFQLEDRFKKRKLKQPEIRKLANYFGKEFATRTIVVSKN